jgi:hypothetical protein
MRARAPVLCCLAQVWTVVTGETLHALTAGPDWRQAMTLPVPLEDQLRTLWLRLRHAALWHLLKANIGGQPAWWVETEATRIL